MTRMTQQETVDRYTGALSTMTAVLDELRDLPDTDGSITALARRIEAERDWVRALMSLGAAPTRPPGWLRRIPSRTAALSSLSARGRRGAT
jgi:hypothetical protein